MKTRAGMEVVAQEAEARAGQRGRQQRRAAAVEREREDRERRGRDRPDAGREAVHAVDEVEAVHQRDDPEHRHRVLQRAEVERMQQRQREVVDRRPGGDRDRGRRELARRASTIGWISKRSSSRPTRRAHAGAEQDRVRAPAERRAAAAARAPRPRRTSRCRRRTGSGACAAAGPELRWSTSPTRVASARRERRQPEREHAGEAERDERVEAGLRHGRAFARDDAQRRRRPARGADADDERAVPRRRQRRA